MKNKNNIYRKHTKSYFDKWYKEYQNFMEWENAPNYKLKFYYSKEYCSSYYKKDKNNLHTITVNELLLPTHHSNAKAIAYHEFTHIYDHCNIIDDDNYLSICGEYHAVNIQMKCALNFKSENDDIKINETDLVYDGINSLTVKDYLLYITKDAKVTIESYLDKNDINGIINALRQTIYYFSKIDFFSKYMLDIQSVSECYDLFFLTKIFGVDIVSLHILLQKNNIYNKNQLLEMHNLICKIGSDYLKHNKMF